MRSDRLTEGSIVVSPEGSVVVSAEQISFIKANLREALGEAEKVEKSASFGEPWTARTHRLRMTAHLAQIREVFE